MTWTAVALLAPGVLLAEPVSRMSAGARWPTRDPLGALLLWQAAGLAGGLVAGRCRTGRAVAQGGRARG